MEQELLKQFRSVDAFARGSIIARSLGLAESGAVRHNRLVPYVPKSGPF